jgi:hypothetical protein
MHIFDLTRILRRGCRHEAGHGESVFVSVGISGQPRNDGAVSFHPALDAAGLSHVWMAPNLQELFCVRSAGRLQSCVRPFGAVAHDRWH